MERKVNPKTRFDLDPVGQYYALCNNGKQPGYLTITAHLNEQIDPQALQQALNDLMHRLPFLSSYLVRGFFGYYNRVLAQPAQIIPANDALTPPSCNKESKTPVLRVFYEERRLIIKVTHSMTDGRGLVKIACALLVRYFELLGQRTDKAGIINCRESLHPEETEDAFTRFGILQKIGFQAKVAVYQHDGLKTAPVRLIQKTYSLDKIKSAAKAYDATITEYILAHIFKAIAGERNARGCKKPINARIPVDCRSFFPSKTLRNFVVNTPIVMPETEDFSEIVQQIRLQFAKIDTDLVLNGINIAKNLQKNKRFWPLVLKKWLMEEIERIEKRRYTITFTNLGLVKLPKEIEERIEVLELEMQNFINSILPKRSKHMRKNVHNVFTCITIGDMLSLSIHASAEDNDIVERIFAGLE